MATGVVVPNKFVFTEVLCSHLDRIAPVLETDRSVWNRFG